MVEVCPLEAILVLIAMFQHSSEARVVSVFMEVSNVLTGEQLCLDIMSSMVSKKGRAFPESEHRGKYNMIKIVE